MIYDATFAYQNEEMLVNREVTDVYKWAAIRDQVDTFAVIKSFLDTHPDDHVLWTITTEQEERWRAAMKKYDMLKFKVFETPFVTNKNYPERGRRIKAILMKGQSNEVKAGV